MASRQLCVAVLFLGMTLVPSVAAAAAQSPQPTPSPRRVFTNDDLRGGAPPASEPSVPPASSPSPAPAGGSDDRELDEARQGYASSKTRPGYWDYNREVYLVTPEVESCVPSGQSRALDLYVHIRSDGTVGAAVMRPQDAVATCVTEAIRRLRFRSPPGGELWLHPGLHIAR